ncbi:MAG: OmpA family protein [Gammaproteobacteria bacterium]|nr:OmpA family protein [Gammaproteobacteria bacterium]MCP5135402.1 OmpA family protein [Gammaproteobacteria bacterium]
MRFLFVCCFAVTMAGCASFERPTPDAVSPRIIDTPKALATQTLRCARILTDLTIPWGERRFYRCARSEAAVPEELVPDQLRWRQTVSINVPRPLRFEVGFASGSSDLSPEASASINGQFEGIRKASRIFLQAMTDASGSRELNERIALQRARAVEQALTRLGTPPSRITWLPHKTTKNQRAVSITVWQERGSSSF